IIVRHSDMRHNSGFESPPSKRFGGNFIKHRITGALSHDRISDFAAPSIDSHDANTASSDIGALRLVWVLRQRSAHSHGLCSRYPRVPEDLPKWRPAHVQAVH